MKHDEAREWIKGNRSTSNNIPQDPFETWEVRISQADAARTQEAYWSLRAWNEYRVKEAPDEENRILRLAIKAIFEATDPYADGAPDATAHDKLCNEISALARAGMATGGLAETTHNTNSVAWTEGETQFV